MKKNDPSVAPYPFKSEAEKVAYKKNMESIVKPGFTEMGRKERPASEMAEMVAQKSNAPKKTKVDVMKKTVLKAEPLKSKSELQEKLKAAADMRKENFELSLSRVGKHPIMEEVELKDPGVRVSKGPKQAYVGKEKAEAEMPLFKSIDKAELDDKYKAAKSKFESLSKESPSQDNMKKRALESLKKPASKSE